MLVALRNSDSSSRDGSRAVAIVKARRYTSPISLRVCARTRARRVCVTHSQRRWDRPRRSSTGVRRSRPIAVGAWWVMSALSIRTFARSIVAG